MDFSKLQKEIGKNVFVVSLRFEVKRGSDHGKLEMINEPDNIVLALKPFGDSIIPIDNGSDKILKVYNQEGIVVYDNETPVKKEKVLKKDTQPYKPYRPQGTTGTHPHGLK